MRLITRSDFDGLACGALLKEAGIIDHWKFAHPKDLQDGLVEVTEDDCLANVPFVEGCGLWFDHHSSEHERMQLEGKYKGESRVTPSCARIIYEYYGGKEKFPQFDDMMEAVDYYQKLLGVVPDHYLSHWKNEGFFKAGGFVKEAADGDVSIAFVNIPGTKLTLELMQYHSPEGRKEPIFFAANDVSGARHVALKITNIDEAFLHIKSMPDTKLINETEDYQVFQISKTTPDEVHFFDQKALETDERNQQAAKILSEVRYFYFIDKYGLQWEFEQGHTDIGD